MPFFVTAQNYLDKSKGHLLRNFVAIFVSCAATSRGCRLYLWFDFVAGHIFGGLIWAKIYFKTLGLLQLNSCCWVFINFGLTHKNGLNVSLKRTKEVITHFLFLFLILLHLHFLRSRYKLRTEKNLCEAQWCSATWVLC